ncbi:MAG TPA: tRNA (adenosine(37)-N6)-threonylcarbamoyltransferase complex ATPase subunit type 1 TsaE [Aminobacterium sp.]|nr:tRNA (adenosine(37)-N6)-threonylcarbamoyltransferase complex ATPase subunit type 1 TsaE [Aminobacterium sp.]
MKFISSSPEETILLGQFMSHHVYPGLVILLYGDLGAGKTELVRGLGNGLGIRGVRSPSFTLINEYKGQLLLAHVDLYRLHKGAEDELGLFEYIDEGFVVVIEWPDRLVTVPDTDVWLFSFEIKNQNTREIRLSARGPKAEKALYALLSDVKEGLE